jgi:aminoglycoside phosphotransferase (APT) family kinase protein
MHDDELALDAALVRRLIDAQFPHWADEPVRELGASGSSNALFRLGEDLLVRLPRQSGGGAAIVKEARWARTLARILPVAVPEVQALGEATPHYPERWSVVRWLDGAPPTTTRPGDALARDLAAAVTALRQAPVSAEARTDPALRWYRARPLAELEDKTRADLAACRRLEGLDLDLAAAERVWEEAMRLPSARADHAEHWLHADLLAENLLVRDGRLAAVLDLGGLAVGDPTVDLIAAWQVLDASGRDLFRRAVAVEEETWLRGRAWALAIALMILPYYWETLPERCAAQHAVAQAVITDHG